MRLWAAVAVIAGCTSPLLFACSGGDSLPNGAVTPSSGDDASGGGGGGDATGGSGDGAASDGGGGAADACVFTVDDAGVTHGCGKGGMGPGDRDDGGDAAAPPPSDASPDAADLPFGTSCLGNAQCASGLCFDYAVKGTFCTKTCSSNADCPPPSLGCNGMGVCRMGN